MEYNINANKINKIIDNNPTVKGLVEDVRILKKDVLKLKDSVHFLTIIVENSRKEALIFYEVMLSNSNFARPKIEDHEFRISGVEIRTDVLESVAKAHAKLLSQQKFLFLMTINYSHKKQKLRLTMMPSSHRIKCFVL